MVIIAIAMDSFHTDGVHCPDLEVSLPGETLKIALENLTTFERWTRDLVDCNGQLLSVASFRNFDKCGYSKITIYRNKIRGVAIAYRM